MKEATKTSTKVGQEEEYTNKEIDEQLHCEDLKKMPGYGVTFDEYGPILQPVIVSEDEYRNHHRYSVFVRRPPHHGESYVADLSEIPKGDQLLSFIKEYKCVGYCFLVDNWANDHFPRKGLRLGDRQFEPVAEFFVIWK